MMPYPEYSRLLPSTQTSESDEVESLTPENSGWHSTIATPAKSPWFSASTAWKAMILSLVLSLAISAVNLTFLSTWATVSPNYGSTTTSEPLDYPSVYIGLENVARNTSQCLNRPTFPDNFYTYDSREESRATLHRVYAPEDEVTLTFGGPVSLQ